MENLQNVEYHITKNRQEGKNDIENDINVEVNHKGIVDGSPMLLFNISTIRKNDDVDGSNVKDSKSNNEANNIISCCLTNQFDSTAMSSKIENPQTNCISQTVSIHSYGRTSSCPIKLNDNDHLDNKCKSLKLKYARTLSNDTSVNESRNSETCKSKLCTDDIEEEQVGISKESVLSENNDDQNFNYRPSFTKRITIERLTWLPQPPKLSDMKFFSSLEDAFRCIKCKRS